MIKRKALILLGLMAAIAVLVAGIASITINNTGRSKLIVFHTMDSKYIDRFLENISSPARMPGALARIYSPGNITRILDSPPYTMVSGSPHPLMEGMYDVKPYNLSDYLYDQMQGIRRIIYSGIYNTSYGARLWIEIYLVKTHLHEEALAVIYGEISDWHAWNKLLAKYIVLSGLGYQSMEEALLRIYGFYKYRDYRLKEVLWRIPFPNMGGKIIVNGKQLPIEAIVGLAMPVYPLTSSLGWLEQTIETLYWSLIAQPAFSLALRLTYPENADVEKIYIEELPRMIRAIAYPGVSYGSPGEIYETPLYIRLNGIGVCGDYSLAAMILGDSAFSAPVLKLSGKDPHTGMMHSIAVLLVPSRIFRENSRGIDLDGDGKPDTLLKITDTAGLSWSDMKKGGFLNNIILDPGPTLYSVNPLTNNGTYNWVYGVLAGYPEVLAHIPSVLRMPWYNWSVDLMKNTYMNITHQCPPDNDLAIMVAWAYTISVLSPTRYYWLTNTSLTSSPFIIADEIIGHVPVNTSLYGGIEKWLGITVFFLDRYLSPPNILQGVKTPSNIGSINAVDNVLYSIWLAEKGASTKDLDLVIMGLKPVFKSIVESTMPIMKFTGWLAQYKDVSVNLSIISYENCTYRAVIKTDSAGKVFLLHMPPLRDQLLRIGNLFILLVQERHICPNIIVTAKTVPAYPYPMHIYYKYIRIYNTSIAVRIMGEDYYKHLSLTVLVSGIPPILRDMINPYIFAPNKTFEPLPFNMTFNGYLNITINMNTPHPLSAETIIGIKISGNTHLNIYIIIPQRIIF